MTKRDPRKDVMTTDDVAQYMSVTRAYVRSLVRQGRLDADQRKGVTLFVRSDVERLQRERAG